MLTVACCAVAAVVLIALHWVMWARVNGLTPARMLLSLAAAVFGVLRYRRRWLEAVARLTESDERNDELRVRLIAETSKSARSSAALVIERETSRMLQEVIAELCVDIAELEGIRDAELVRRSEEIAVVLQTSTDQRAEQAYAQIMKARQ